jgi:hypothetical protein
VPHLQPGTRYSFRVAAANSQGAGPFSEPATVTTAFRPPEPPADLAAVPLPPEAAADAVAALPPGAARAGLTAAIAVSWCAPAPAPATADVASYEVEAAPVDPASSRAHGGQPVRATAGRVQQCALPGLLPGGQYTVRARTVGADGAGHGGWSAAVAVELPAPPPRSTDGDSDGASVAAADGAAAGAGEGRGAGRRKGRRGGAAEPGAQQPEQQAQQGPGAQKRKAGKQWGAQPVGRGPVAKRPLHEQLLQRVLPQVVFRQRRRLYQVFVVALALIVFLGVVRLFNGPARRV